MRLRCALAVAAFAVLAALPAQASAQDRPWLDPGRPPDERARLVLDEMTLEEKVSLMHGAGAKTVDGESFQVHVRGIERLGIPDQTFADGATGIRGGTQLPAPIALLPSRLPNRAALAREKDAANAFARGRLLSEELAADADVARVVDRGLGPQRAARSCSAGGSRSACRRA